MTGLFFKNGAELRNHLESLDLRTALNLADERKRAESEFHDKDRDVTTKTDQGNRKFYCTAKLSSNFREQWIRENAPGKVFLDYACGDGRYSMIAAEAAADLVIGVDISDVSVRLCKEAAAKSDLSNKTFFYQGDCEATGLPDSSVDLVLCSGVLHHLDLNNVFPELKRILKPGGRVFVLEALNYNPFIKLYRRLTPQMRTAWESEHILSKKDLRYAGRYFSVRKLKYWHLMSLLATPFRNRRIFDPLLTTFNAIDQTILKIPGLREMAWMFSCEMVK